MDNKSNNGNNQSSNNNYSVKNEINSSGGERFIHNQKEIIVEKPLETSKYDKKE